MSTKSVNIGVKLTPEHIETTRAAAHDMVAVGEHFKGVMHDVGEILDELERAEMEVILSTGGASQSDVETILEARRSIHAVRGLRSKIQERVNLVATGKGILNKLDSFEKANRPTRAK